MNRRAINFTRSALATLVGVRVDTTDFQSVIRHTESNEIVHEELVKLIDAKII